ncbi:hypothetical protein M2432_005174 [Mycobacterium sp. OTB74]|jgi:hypothetical protein|nr:hypothetical protein [Mycobacterium sp. OTB74]
MNITHYPVLLFALSAIILGAAAWAGKRCWVGGAGSRRMCVRTSPLF